MAEHELLTRADGTPTLEGWVQLIVDLARSGEQPKDIAMLLGMDGEEGTWSVHDVEEVLKERL